MRSAIRVDNGQSENGPWVWGEVSHPLYRLSMGNIGKSYLQKGDLSAYVDVETANYSCRRILAAKLKMNVTAIRQSRYRFAVSR